MLRKMNSFDRYAGNDPADEHFISELWASAVRPRILSRARINNRRKDRQGATLVLLAFLILILVGMVAFSVDVGRMYLVRNQLQTAVDAGALAGGLKLKHDPTDIEAAVAAAEQFVQLNRVGFLVTVPEDAITVEMGVWNPDTHTFTATNIEPDSIRVLARREDEPLFFSGVFGERTFSVPRTAIASIGGEKFDIVMTLDLSGSMSSSGRIEALQVAAPEFVNVIEEVGDDDRIGVFGYGAIKGSYDPASHGHSGTVYGNTPEYLYPEGEAWAAVVESELTDDFDALRNNVLDSQTLAADKYNGWTPIGAAIRDSAHYLNADARDDVQKVIVLMSDGHANKPSGNGPGYAKEMAAYAAGLDIKIYTISLGNGADEQLMQDIADATGGEHFIANGTGANLTESLTKAFRSVASAVKRTQIVD